MVHAGVYQESLIISKPVGIIGVAFGDVSAVQIESCLTTTITFEMGAGEALLGHLTVKVNSALWLAEVLVTQANRAAGRIVIYDE